MANPDGTLWVEHRRRGRTLIGSTPRETTEAVIRLVATSVGRTINHERPMISAMLPPTICRNSDSSPNAVAGKCRFQGVRPPLAPAPSFVIRKLGSMVWNLDDYVAAGIATHGQVQALRAGVAERRNTIVAGGTGSGKTTLLNACLNEACFRDSRVVLLEDTPELTFLGEDSIRLVAAGSTTLRKLVKTTLRLRPDRIVVGEVRGAEALDMLKAWNTGHPGGLGTVHANGAAQALSRIHDLASEAAPVSRQAIVDAVGLVVFIRRDNKCSGGRLIESVVEPGLNINGEFVVRELVLSP